MKAILLVFTLFNFMCAQVLASSCAMVCDFNSVEAQKQTQAPAPAPMDANHECCNGNSQTDEKTADNPFQCMGDLGGVCFHEVASTNIDKEAFEAGFQAGDKKLIIEAKPVFYSHLLIGKISQESPPLPRFGGRHYLKFKEGLRLHIIKDQFLI